MSVLDVTDTGQLHVFTDDQLDYVVSLLETAREDLDTDPAASHNWITRALNYIAGAYPSVA